MSSTIEKLPDNLLKIVADYLNPRDVMNLSMCSKVLYSVSVTQGVTLNGLGTDSRLHCHLPF